MLKKLRLSANIHKFEDFYDKKEKIGESKDAIVYRCGEEKSSGKEFAVKIMKKRELDERATKVDYFLKLE